MKLLFFVGPPAVGKFTVAKEIGLRTAFPVLHNHVAIDCVREILPYDHPHFNRTVDMVRLTLIESAIKAKLRGLILTFSYTGSVNDRFLCQVEELTTAGGGKLDFVRLFAPRTVLLDRVGNPDRLPGKLKDAAIYAAAFETVDFFAVPPQTIVCDIDTSKYSATEAAALIIDKCKLLEP